jgi:dTDP-4-dehydrorhamnose 3,5-epimerase
MKILSVDTLALPEVKVIRFARFGDTRGYFTETFRRSDIDGHPALASLRGVALPQCNESFSRAGVLRGLHFQWAPAMGKLVRTVCGRMVDIFLDIRTGSPTFGKIAMHDMTAPVNHAYAEWIWVPPGFAHGNFFSADTHIEYLCSAEYSAGTEAGVSPLAADFDWSICDAGLKAEFDTLIARGATISDKDRQAPSLTVWAADERSRNFVYENV